MADPTPPLLRPLVIGWREALDFPTWQVEHVLAKIDTGANSSALDVDGYELATTTDGVTIARLRLAWDRQRLDEAREVQASLVRWATVKNTAGFCQSRPVIQVTVRLGPILKPIEMTLTNRSHMSHRVILGREALRNDFIVDVSKEFVLGGLSVRRDA